MANMSAETHAPADTHEMIHLGGETAVVVPLAEYRVLAALRKKASAQEIEEAEAEILMAGYDDWVDRGRPGAMSHEEFRAELTGGAR